MDEDLLIDILSALKAGEIYPGDIQRSWEKNGKFVDNAEFHTAWQLLKSKKAIIPMPNENDVAKTIINPYNDILPALLKRQQEKIIAKEQESTIKNLEFQNMQTHNLLMVDQVIDYPKIKRQKRNAYVATIIMTLVAIASLIVAIQQYLKCK